MKKLLGILSILFAFQASAGFLIEPYINYDLSVMEEDSNTNFAFAQKGVSMGARLGLTFGPAFLAYDFETGSKDLVWDGSGTFPDLESTTKNNAITAGIDVPIAPIRAYVKYVFSAVNTVDFTPAPVPVNAFGKGDFEGSGFAVGLGLTFLPIVDINIEYKSLTFTEFDGDSLDNDFKNTGLSIGLSAPFSL